jgi:hypothetical protein
VQRFARRFAVSFAFARWLFDHADMGQCSFCGKPAGIFRSAHADCRDQHDRVAAGIPDFFLKSLTSPLPAEQFRKLTMDVASVGFISDAEFRSLALQGLTAMVQAALADSVVTKAEEDRIAEIRDAFGLDTSELGEVGRQLVKAEILRDLDEGRLPKRVKLEGHLPIVLERDEDIIWIFNDVTFSIIRSQTHWAGRSQGVSIRIMKGVYYRAGASKGQPIQTQYLSEEGRGDLVIASRNLYFVSPMKSLRVPSKKIVAVQAYSDGIQITRDGVSAKPMIFVLDDPWFASNAIVRLASAS